MSFPVHLLRNHADCDAAKAALTRELREFVLNDQVLDLRADKSVERADDRAKALQQAQNEVTRLTPQVAAMTAGTREHRYLDRLLTQATRRVQDLSLPPAPGTHTAVDVFLQAVDVRQVQVQVPELEQAIIEVTAHRATLAA
ncbi:hypothetical protein [Hymenobacter chitinivorans]|uniref:Uncharacterized protein n=1 Tax=Hymenobacter chitinivorans DSM 11115 TaxID=1121954 RepID=A0A2M9ASG4_9BACT|nr:hypothetical protein [Hymenobacter chitinivorans]PJJ48644.1 hypothetical protein CLV45_4353 [Hymenobacter chitinivorans DSM 11115]